MSEVIIWTCPDEEMFVGFDIVDNKIVAANAPDDQPYTRVVKLEDYLNLESKLNCAVTALEYCSESWDISMPLVASEALKQIKGDI